MKIILTGNFDSAHHLPGYPGLCSRVHGHTYRYELSLADVGEFDGKMIIDFHSVKRILTAVLERWDHYDITGMVPYPSVENIALALGKEILSALKINRLKVRLDSLRIWEGMGCAAEVNEDDIKRFLP